MRTESIISRSRASLYLTLILLVGTVLRIWGISFGLPELNHADEPIVVNHALAYGLGDFNPHFFNIPPLTSYLLFLAYGFYFLFGFLSGSFAGTEDFLNLFLKDPSSFYLLGRLFIGVVFGVLSIYMLYRIFRLLMSREIALLGTFLGAVLYLPVKLSHFIYPDSPLYFTILFSLYFYLRIGVNGKLKDYLLALCGTGFAIGLKYNAALLLVPFFTVHFLRTFLRSKQGKVWNCVGAPILCGLFVVFVFFILNPYFFFDFRFALGELREQSSATGFLGFGHHLFYSVKEALGLPLFIFSLVSLVAGLFFIKKHPYLLIFYSYGIAFYLHLVYFAQPYGRYGILLLPPLIFVPIFVINQVYLRIKKLLPISVFVLLLALVPMYQCVLLGKVLTAPDTRNQAKEWFVQKIPTGAKVFFNIDRFAPRLPYCKEDLYDALSKVDPASAKAKRIRALIELKTDSVCFHVSYEGEELDETSFALSGNRMPLNWDRLGKEEIRYLGLVRLDGENPNETWLNELKAHGKLIARFSPFKNPTQNYSSDPIDLTGAPLTLRDLSEREANGQLIEIYELN